jgi:hypothetical protein
LGLVLWEVREYKPALALVCRRWAAAIAQAKIPKAAVLRASGLAARGHALLLRWLRTLWPFYRVVPPKMVSKAAAGGHMKLCNDLMAEWDASEETKVMSPIKGVAIRGDIDWLRMLLDEVRARDMRFWPHDLRAWGARGGHAAVCHFTHALNAEQPDKSELGMMLQAAASRGHGELCRQLIAWGASVEWMVRAAVEYDAKHGGTRMCDLAKELGATEMNEMLEAAARTGNEMLCLKAQGWGANDWLAMFFGAVEGGQVALCRKAKELLVLARENAEDTLHEDELGGSWEDLMGDALAAATESSKGLPEDRETICRLLIEWGGNTVSLFGWAITHNNVQLAWLAMEINPEGEYVEWLSEEEEASGACPLGEFVLGNPKGSYDELLTFGVEWSHNSLSESHRLCEMALDGGTHDVNWLLCGAAFTDDEILLELAVRYGARDFNGMLMAACAGEHDSLIALAQKWGATATPRPAADLIQASDDL